MRSCLEYAAQDINSHLSIPKRRFYFPYGDSIEKLNESVQGNLLLLRNELPKVYNEIVELHNLKLGNQWLKNLCDLTNHAKHTNAIEIISDHDDIKEVKIAAGGVNLFHGIGNCSVTFTNCKVNNQAIDDFVLNGGEIQVTKKREIPINFRIIKDRKILINNSNTEIYLLPFLESSIKSIDLFVTRLL
ncbi:hypothetical protein [Acinetobacter sp. ANC 3791]|uniref:hypothetical protein n=1 Tax=Acinetobacter sp. ANC 3791 TaxID=2529836 RepID=UPI0010392C08|nr:hypothetical protein [Acinetobacter sp. ANC 3791]TCB83175.1 hypothetical protein E0H90_12755 [Acinetobacter sp. ANC 3791]